MTEKYIWDDKQTRDYFAINIMPFLLSYAAQTTDASARPGYIDIFGTLSQLTGAEPSIDVVQEMLDKHMVTLEKELKEPSESQDILSDIIPKYDADKKDETGQYPARKKFQELVKERIRSAPPDIKLMLLNKIQKNTPFVIADPRKKYDKNFSYGYADLIRFACLPVNDGTVYRFIKNSPGKKKELDQETGIWKETDQELENPFYNPIRYPLPDYEANKRLEDIIIGSRRFNENKLRELKSLQKYLKGSKKIAKDEAKSKLNAMVNIFIEVYKYGTNPVYLSKQVKDQVRPIAEYRKDHFLELLMQLSTRKRLHPASVGHRAPESNTGFEFIDPELNIVKKLTRKSKSKRKSRKGY
jgi:hypothetical protein